MTWSEQAWKSCEKIFEKIIKQPFIQELMDGSLPREKFLFYQNQDAFYLAEYGRILAAIASRLDSDDWRDAFLSFSKDTLLVEKVLHQSYLKDDFKNTEPSLSNMLYTGYLWSRLAGASLNECLAAVLPCFWVYKEVGDYIIATRKTNDNPYQAWIDTYGSEDFAAAVDKAIMICDSYANDSSEEMQKRMTKAFETTFKMEWLFWQSAYEMEQWRI
ncbi:MAG: TenA family protein [Bacteroidales bacterium]